MNNYYIKPSLHSNRSRDAVALARDFEKGLERRTPKALQTRWTRGIILQKIFKIHGLRNAISCVFLSTFSEKKKTKGKLRGGKDR